MKPSHHKASLRHQKSYRLGLLLALTSLLFFAGQAAHSQESEPGEIKIYLWTVSPGPKLFSAPGHSALEVDDGNPATKNLIYEYGGVPPIGSSDGDENPNRAPIAINESCETRLARETRITAIEAVTQLLLEDLTALKKITGRQEFESRYRYDTRVYRKISRDRLQLTQAQARKVIETLQEEFKCENRKYKYNNLRNNCATKLRDIVLDSLGESAGEPLQVSSGDTFKRLYMDTLTEGAKSRIKPTARTDRNSGKIENLFEAGELEIIPPDMKQMAIGMAKFMFQIDIPTIIHSGEEFFEATDSIFTKLAPKYEGKPIMVSVRKQQTELEQVTTIYDKMFLPVHLRSAFAEVLVNPETGQTVIDSNADDSYTVESIPSERTTPAETESAESAETTYPHPIENR